MVGSGGAMEGKMILSGQHYIRLYNNSDKQNVAYMNLFTCWIKKTEALTGY
jgi:hypothetical protein